MQSTSRHASLQCKESNDGEPECLPADRAQQPLFAMPNQTKSFLIPAKDHSDNATSYKFKPEKLKGPNQRLGGNSCDVNTTHPSRAEMSPAAKTIQNNPPLLAQDHRGFKGPCNARNTLAYPRQFQAIKNQAMMFRYGKYTPARATELADE